MDMTTFGFDVVVMCTGIILVFMILVLLMLIITLEGKIFDARANGKKKGEKALAKAAQPASGANVQKADAPVVEKGISNAVVAAIAAAIAAISGGRYTLRAVRRAGGEPRGSWGRAGVSDVTSPF